MGIKELYQDFGIPYWTEGKNVQKGWVNTTCPFCNDPSNHLGFGGRGFNCWRCGPHPVVEAISEILQVSKNYALQLIQRYRILDEYTYLETEQDYKKELKYPSNLLSYLPNAHQNYLIKRDFDPKKIARIWKVKATGPISKLDDINLSNRILIPIFWNGKEVTYQTRDITEKHRLRYINCPSKYQILNPKHILYGKQERWTNKLILVEGIFDVWRLGTKSAALFGLGYTIQQLRILSNFDHIFIVFDNDEPAQKTAQKLSSELKFRGVKVTIFNDLPAKDPAELSQSNARYLVKYLIGK